MRNIALTPIIYRTSCDESFMQGPIAPLTPATLDLERATEEMEQLEAMINPIGEAVLRDILEGEE